jgi:cardiolipin synthase
LLIFIGILFIIGIWLRLDYLLGRRYQLSKIKRREYPFRQSDLELFTHGKDLFTDLFDQMNGASHHIHILFYIVKNDKFSKEFIHTLQKKAKDGVEVRLLLDWVGSSSISKNTINSLKKAGVHVSYCHVPRAPFFFYSLQVRNHRKLIIIDGNLGYIGGYNVGKEYIDFDPKLSPWRDYHLKMTGEGVLDLQREFLKDWRVATKINLLQDTVYFPSLYKGSIKHQLIPSEGFFLEETFSTLIQNAQKSITIGSPYFIPSKQIFQDLLQALERGVKVIILVPNRSDHALVKEASFPFLRKLLKNGARIYQFTEGFYHAKSLLVDHRVCDVGTANFDKRSLFLNHEINCYIYDSHFVQQMEEIFNKDIQNAKPLSLDEISRKNPFRAMKELTARMLSHFL